MAYGNQKGPPPEGGARSGPAGISGYQGPRVGVQSLPAVDATSIKASANRWGAAADIFTHISSGWQQIVTRDAVELAKQEGARTAADATTTATVNGPTGDVQIQIPKLNKIDGYGAYAQAFNASARDTYGKRVELQARQSIKELEQTHQADPVGLEKALAALQPALLGDIETQDPATATEVKFLYGALGTDAVLRAKDAALAVERDANQAATLQAIDTYQTSFSQHMREAGKGNTVAAGLAELDRAALEQQLISHGPKIPYEINGRKYPGGDGSLEARWIQEQMIKLDREGAQQTQLGWWESGPQTAARADAWAKSDVPGITQDQKDILHRSFLADADRAESKAKAAANEARATAVADLSMGWGDAKTNALVNGVVDPKYIQTMAANLSPVEFKKRSEELYAAQNTHNFNIANTTAPISEGNAAVISANPANFSTATEVQANTFSMMAQANKDKLDAIAKDPAGYAVQNFPAAQSAFSTMAAMLNDPNATPDQIEKSTDAFMAQTRAALDHLGVPPENQTILPEAFKNQLAALMSPQEMARDPATVQNVINKITLAFGPDASRVMGEIGSKLPEAVQVAAVVQPGDQATVLNATVYEADAWKSIAVKYPDLKKDDVIAASDLALQDAANTFGADGNGTIATMQTASHALTAQYVAQGMDVTKAAAKAAQTVFGNMYNVQGTLRVPVNYNAELVGAGAGNALNTITPDMLDPAQIVSLSGLQAGETAAQYAGAIQRGGYWRTASDPQYPEQADKGAYLYDPLNMRVLGTDGKPIFKSFDELAAGGSIPTTRVPADRPANFPTPVEQQVAP